MATKSNELEICWVGPDESEFQNLLSKFGEIYDTEERYKWLRLLLFDVLPESLLCREDIRAIDLFKKLADVRVISCVQVELLSNVAEVTQLVDAKSLIQEYIRDNELPTSYTSSLLPYRTILFRAMKKITNERVAHLIDQYSSKHQELKDIWDVIFFLERQKVLKPDHSVVEQFSRKLNERARSILLEFVNYRPKVMVHSEYEHDNDVYCKVGPDERQFQDLLSKFGEIYDTEERYKWLRLLLFDVLPERLLCREDIRAINLFKKLADVRVISCVQVELLSNVAEVTQLVEAKSLIQEYIRDNELPTSYTSSLLPYRTILFRAVNEITNERVAYLIDHYSSKHQELKDIWDVIFFLERQKVLKPDHSVVEQFSRKLNERARSILQEFLNYTPDSGFMIIDQNVNHPEHPRCDGSRPETMRHGIRFCGKWTKGSRCIFGIIWLLVFFACIASFGYFIYEFYENDEMNYGNLVFTMISGVFTVCPLILIKIRESFKWCMRNNET